MSILQAVRGTRDLLPPETGLWNYIEAIARGVFERYSFGEIRTPIFEGTQLFARGVGEETDIVSKEMYTFTPEPGQSLTLRPENTAGVVRAYIEHQLGETGQLQKLYYIGPQFRRERPQKGRYRQFWQIGAEVIGPQSAGSESPLRDAEVLEALAPVKESMSADNQRRAETNPLRVLDSKDPADEAIIATLPKIADYLDEESKAHFASVLAALDACGVKYEINPRLVRGLDYYTRTTFEFTHGGLGAQNALLGGGRYDGLSEMLGGPKAPGIAFAMGLDRIILTLQSAETESAPGASQLILADAFIAPLGEQLNAPALSLARELRRAGLRIDLGAVAFRIKKSFEIGNKLARNIILLGEDEQASGILTVKNFATGDQTKVPASELAQALQNRYEFVV